MLLSCFNVSTMAPSGPLLQLFNIARDPLEADERSVAEPATVTRLLKRLAQFAAQTDQYPPTLKPTITNGTGHVTYNGSTSWNFQCPQCRVVGAHGSPKAWRPWCDGVQCKPESCESLFFGDQCSDRTLRD